jgi:glycosyltransferase involved in cell wall biosynthesis
MSLPTVSVIIPCFNQGGFLAEALDSVRSQTLPATQIILVDDGSTDDTAAVARRYPGVKYVRQPNRGLAAARNAGLARSSGDFIVFLDADDRLKPEALDVGRRELLAHPECALVWGYCVRISEHGQPLPTVPPPPVVDDPYEMLLRSNFIWTPAVAMFRRWMGAPLMRFDPAFDAAADYELYLRIARTFPMHGHTAVVAEYRLHGASMSRNAAVMLTSTMEVLRAQRPYVARRRAYARAYEEGRRSWQGFYGEQLVEQLSRQVRNPRRWIEAGSMMAVLARYYPRGLAAHMARAVLDRPSRRPPRRVRRMVSEGTSGSSANTPANRDRAAAPVPQPELEKRWYNGAGAAVADEVSSLGVRSTRGRSGDRP